MNERETFDKFVGRVAWIKEIIQRRKWVLKQDLIVEPPATPLEIDEIEKILGQRLPDDYKKLFSFSRRVEFRYQFEEEMPDEFSQLFSGEIYWDLGKLKEQLTNFHAWVEASLDPALNDHDAIEVTRRLWPDKIPMIEVPNGDIILIGSSPSEVVYFSHEGDRMHGKRLSDNLWDFLEFHSRIGFIGSEDWQFEPFYDFEMDKMITSGDTVDRFIKWLNK